MTRYLGDYPEWQETIREELRAAFSAAVEEKRQPNVNEINKSRLPNLEAFAEETLRLWPPFFQDKRDTMCDTTLLGVPIPKGTEILIPTGGPGVARPAIPCAEELHSEECRKKFNVPSWDPEDIATFRPDRWLVEDENGQLSFNPRAGPTLAFGLGPRKCFGQRLAYMQIRNVIALLLWNFRFKKMEGKFASKDAKLEMSMIPKYCYVALEKV
jgi:cytochrome P450